MLIPFHWFRGEMLTGVIAVFALHTLWHHCLARWGRRVIFKIDQSISLSFCVSCLAVFGARVVSCLSDQRNLHWANVLS